MMVRVLPALAAGFALAASAALAQTGSQGPSSTATAGANAKAADEQSKGFTTPTPPGANMVINGVPQPENCTPPISFGIGSLRWGLTAILTHEDRGCTFRRNSQLLHFYGYVSAAVQELCQLPDVHRSMATAHTPCEGAVQQ